MDGTPSPHLSPVVRARDTTTGEPLWIADLGRPANGLWWYGDRVLARIASDDDMNATSAVAVIDATDGTVITTIDTDLDIVFVG